MNKLLFISALVFAAACGGKSGGATDPCKDPCKDKKMGAMTCASMAETVAGSMRTAGDMPEDTVAQMQDLFESQCTDTGWSQEAIDCISKATNNEEGEACAESSLTEEQRTSLMSAMNGGKEEGVGDGMDDDGAGDEGMDDGEGME